MRLLALVFFLLTWCQLSLPVHAEESQPSQITLGFIPSDDPVKLKTSAIDLAKRLQAKLKIPVTVFISKNYQGLIDAMKNKKVDFASFTAMSFVFAEKQAGAKVLLKRVWQQPFYYSVILTRSDLKINSIEDLRGKTFAFVDEKSTSGYLYPRVMFQQKKINPDTFFKKTYFTGNHQASIEALLDGKAQAAAVFADDDKAERSAWNNFFPKDIAKKKILWVSEPIPNDPFCVRQDFYDKFPRTTHDLMFALIDLKEDEKDGNVLKSLFGFSEFQLATSRQYQPVREMVKILNLRLDP